MTLGQVSLLFLCFHVLAPLLCTTSNAALLQAFNCSTSDNYTATSAYAANVKQFLAALPENAVSNNGGFYNGTVGEGVDTVYGLAMCPADYSRGDCGDCLTAAAAASNDDGLQNRCPGSRTVLAMFDRCLVRFSDNNFFGTPETGVVLALSGERVMAPGVYSPTVEQAFKDSTDRAVISPQRFAASAGHPYVFVQCTWDLSADKCRQCLQVLSANTSGMISIRREGQRKSYSCALRYSNTSFMVVPFTFTAAPPGSRTQPIGQAGTSALHGHLRKFSYSELARATSNFSEQEELGAGAFGTVYRGKVEGIQQSKNQNVEGVQKSRKVKVESIHVAIKKITMTIPKETSSQQVPVDTTDVRVRIEQDKKDLELVRKDFYNEIKIMSPLHHRNIIRLVGWCKENKSLFLVYELMESGNLEHYLYPKHGTMDTDLHGITASGAILLLDWPKRDIKPSNVLLDKNFNAKLCDFGLVTQFSHNHTSRTTKIVRGTPVYIDPTYVDSQRACQQNDVYSLGILLLEVVCCERPEITDTGHNLIHKVSTCYLGNQILNAADTRLRGNDNFDRQIERVLKIGLACVQREVKQRPHIRRVLECLTNETAQLPFFPTPSCIPLTLSESETTAASSSRNSNAIPAAPPSQSGTAAGQDAGVTPLLP
ncbi:cysteine-rich receptor-like protein kinase 10 [Triticum aestivum]|uniref:cysteine-rich receptor-like protein kinase 10 n=1 Tax=Triticum aestivum TaxID=4565 RepID=UPI001D0056E4|nr:cysteine-rich receptor-like protein kinase 10 [Triticum aestivum]